MYREFSKGNPFQFEHCWKLLKDQPKWFAQCEKKKATRARNGATPAAPSPELINPAPNDTVVEMERPTCTKKEKKRKFDEQASAPVVKLLNAMQEERKSTNEAWNA